MSVVLDTNALMMPVECDVRLFEELGRLLGSSVPAHAAGQSSGDEPPGEEYLIPEAVLAELAKLADGSGEEATAASVGQDLARERCRSVSHEAGYADDAVVECASDEAVTHAVTNDAPLRDRLLDANVPVLSLRGETKLAVTQP
jgi:rRNA-processing protein FCF1